MVRFTVNRNWRNNFDAIHDTMMLYMEHLAKVMRDKTYSLDINKALDYLVEKGFKLGFDDNEVARYKIMFISDVNDLIWEWQNVNIPNSVHFYQGLTAIMDSI